MLTHIHSAIIAATLWGTGRCRSPAWLTPLAFQQAWEASHEPEGKGNLARFVPVSLTHRITWCAEGNNWKGITYEL